MKNKKILTTYKHIVENANRLRELLKNEIKNNENKRKGMIKM